MFDDVRLQALWDGTYRFPELLRTATREGLEKAKLTPALVDYILYLQGAAAGVGLGSAAAAAAEQEAAKRSRKPKSFSSVNSVDAGQLLTTLQIREVRGNVLAREELQTGADIVCSAFDYTPFSNEDAGTPSLLKHHQQQLELLGVQFLVPGGFEVYDFHKLTSDPLLVRVGGNAFRGVFDGCIAPFGLAESSALRDCRIVYEHRKQLRPSDKAQAIVELLAAYAYAPCPVLLDQTDGIKHNVYTIRGKLLIVWAGLGPTQAYHLQARHLLADPTRAQLDVSLNQIPKEEQAWMRTLQQQLRPSSVLEEQLDSVMPFLPPDERMLAARDLIHTWVQSQPEQLTLPASIQAFYS